LTKVKICGIMNLQELDYALSAGADAVGFVVEIGASRHSISAQEAMNLIKHVPIFVKSVAVIAPGNVLEAESLAKKTAAEILQIHGLSNPEELAKIRSRVHQRLIASLSPESQDALAFDKVADAILLDTLKEGMLGGTGKTHNWIASACLAERLNHPVILAGGLNSKNVGDAIRTVRPYAVDVSSGVEADGKKNLEKIESFIKKVRQCP
jgi:phosphoribosylanthranilate isomerase